MQTAVRDDKPASAGLFFCRRLGPFLALVTLCHRILATRGPFVRAIAACIAPLIIVSAASGTATKSAHPSAVRQQANHWLQISGNSSPTAMTGFNFVTHEVLTNVTLFTCKLNIPSARLRPVGTTPTSQNDKDNRY